MELDIRQPIFSIVIPIYNKSISIPACLASLESNNTSLFEVIFIDDASTDDSLTTLRNNLVNSKLNSFVFQNKRNLGTFITRSKGISHASGKYVLFLDPDDLLASSAIDVLNDFVSKFKPKLVMYDYIVYRENQIINGKPEHSYELKLRKPGLQLDLGDYMAINPVCRGIGGKVVSKDVLLSAISMIGNQSEPFVNSEDFLLIIASLLVCRNFYYLPKNLYFYIKNNEGSSVTDNTEAYGLRIFLQTEIFINHLIALKCNEQTISKDISLLDRLIEIRQCYRYMYIRNNQAAHSNLGLSYRKCLVKACLTFTSPKPWLAIAAYFFSFGLFKK